MQKNNVYTGIRLHGTFGAQSEERLLNILARAQSIIMTDIELVGGAMHVHKLVAAPSRVSVLTARS